MAKKTIKYLENGEYHDATVKDVGVIEELKTESKDNLVEAINEIFLGGGKGFSNLQQKVDESTQAAQNAQQATDNLQQRLDEVAQNVGISDEEARKIINQAVEDAKKAQTEALQAYKDAQKELDDSMAQFMEKQKAINKELEQAKADIQGDIDQKNTEIEQINAVIESTKSDLTATSAQLASVRNDLTNAQMDWGKVRTEITNINGKLDSKMSNTDFDEYKERIEHNETEITQTKNELQSKATKQDLDVLTGTVTTQGSNITQLAGKIEEKVSKDTLANNIDDFQVKKANIFTGTREFMGWEFSDKALGRVNDDSCNHAKVAELHNGSNLSITVDGLEVGKTYSVSIFAKASANSNTSGIKVTVDNGKSYSGLMRTVYTPHDTKVTTNWQRYYATIVASATTMKFVFDRSGMTSDITLYLNRPKLEVGETVYAWEDNAQDIYKRVEHTEAQFDVYNDQISGIVQRQTETDKKIENVSSTFTQRADGIEANSKKYTDDKATGLAEEFSGKLRATSQELSTEYEKQTNAKIGALSDGGSNLILNSSFLVTDNNGNATLENWRDTSSKISLTKPNGLDGTWIRVNRATTGTALGARSNYFPVKQGKLVVGVDVALDGTGNISPYVLRIEYYDVSNNRVNYEDITLQKLGLSASQITKSGSNFRYARGVYKTSNDRSDVAKACIVVPETITGYDMYLTNFFAKFSDVNDGTYEVNPLDQQASLIKQRTKIEQDSEKINLLNTQTEKLGNDIKATNTSVNVLKGEVDLKASQSTVNDLTNRVAKNEADIKVFPDKIKSEVSEVSKKIDGVNDKVEGIQVGGTNLLRNTRFSDGSNWGYTGTYHMGIQSTDKPSGVPSDNQTMDIMSTTANSQNALVQTPKVKAGETYTVSFWGKADKETYMQVESNQNTRFNQKIGTSWQKYSGQVMFQSDNRTLYIYPTTANVWVHINSLKLEKGNVPTDWSPAPEDVDASIESVKTVATQTKDGFDRLTQKTGYNTSTGEFSKVTTQINEGIKGVSTQVASVSNRLDNLSVGGTNLLKDSLVPLTTSGVWIADGVSNQIVDDYVRMRGMGNNNRIYQPFSNNSLNADGYYSISFYAGNDGNDEEFDVQVGTWNSLQTVHITTGMIKRYKLENVWLGGNPTFSFVAPFGKVVRLKKIKLEKGTIATDWSPAPEDLQAGINIATTKATQTDTKFERMISQIQYNDSTGEIGKYEHKITELANGTQEKISAIRTDSDKKLQSATQTLTNKIGDLESTVRTNTTNIGQYRQEMTNSAEEWSTKFTSVQNNIGSVSNRLDNLSVGGTNLVRNSAHDPISLEHWTTNNVGTVRYSTHSFFRNGTTKMFFLDNKTNQEMMLQTEYIDIEPDTDYTLSMVVFGASGVSSGDVYYNIKYKDGSDTYFNVDRAFKYNHLKAERKVYHFHTSPNSSGSPATQVFIRIDNNGLIPGYSDGTSMLGDVKLEKGTIATDWSPAPEDTTDKIEVLSGKVTANSNEFSTIYTKITNAKNDAINAIKGDSQWQSIGKIVTNASFLQNSDGFAQEVVKTATPMIEGGGKNLARGTSDSWTGVGRDEFSGGTNFIKFVAYVYLDDLSIGDKVTVQIIYQYSGVTTSNAQCWLQGEGNVTSWNSGNFYDTSSVVNMQTGTDVKHGSVKYTFNITADMKKNSFWRVYYRFDNVNKGAWFQWSKFKVERGSVATPWIPAPEDLATKLQLNDISSRTEFLQDDSKFLLRVQQAGGATQADVNSANSKISGLSDRVESTEVAITSGGVTINGNTKINGALNIGENALKNGDNEISITSENGISLNDKKNGNALLMKDGIISLTYDNGNAAAIFAGNGIEFGGNTNGSKEVLGALGQTYLADNNSINGLGIIIEPLQTLGKPYGGDIFTISSVTSDRKLYNSMVYDAVGKSGFKGFSFFENARFYPPGAGNGITTGWIQYGNGYKAPTIMNVASNYGGIAFPRDGETYIFSATGWLDSHGHKGGGYSHWSS